MLNIVIFFTAILLTISATHGTPLRDRDLDAIVNLLQNHVEKEKSSDESLSNTSEADESSSFVEHLKTMDVIDLIQKANKEENSRVQNQNQKYRYRANRNSVNQNPGSYYNDRSNYGIKKRIMDLLQEEEKPLKKVSHKRLTPNRLLNPAIKMKEDDDKRENEGSNDYSKIFVILDPVALKNSNDDIPTLVSKILASQSVKKARPESRVNGHRYKSFMVKDRSRRFRRESKEMYGGGGGGGGGGGDMEDDYRPKRPRNDHGGGGGGGRTAIPYIRHRGDIYERDH